MQKMTDKELYGLVKVLRVLQDRAVEAGLDTTVDTRNADGIFIIFEIYKHGSFDVDKNSVYLFTFWTIEKNIESIKMVCDNVGLSYEGIEWP